MFIIEEELKKLPEKPGVYLMHDENDEIIYVGKAKVLKNRVKQYFQKTVKNPRTELMVSKIKYFEYIITDNEVEALILECNLIKLHKPKYNVLLKDDKTYPFIKVTLNETYPRVIMSRRVLKDGAKYYGPYIDYMAVKDTLLLIKKIFPLKLCNKNFDNQKLPQKTCLNYHIGQCMGPCKMDVSKEDYLRVVEEVCDFLDGKQSKVISSIEDKMNKASENLDFEKAAIYRDRIVSAQKLIEKQKITLPNENDMDIIGIHKIENIACVHVFFVRSGKILGRDSYFFENVENNEGEILSQFIKQFYINISHVPNKILVRHELEDLDTIKEWLKQTKNVSVDIRIPQKGDKEKLLELSEKNAHFAILRRLNKPLVNINEKLAKLLQIDVIPKRIEAYDISNTGASDKVASMVVFEDGVVHKKDYRLFKIRTVVGQDDVSCMYEAITRRLDHIDNPNKTSFGELPDIILVDGAQNQMNIAKKALVDMGFDTYVFGMVKDDKHRTRGLLKDDGTLIELKENREMLNYIAKIQDEVHDFAINYHRKLRTKNTIKSELDEIQGIGPAKKRDLLNHFDSVENIKNAQITDLLDVAGISPNLAEKIFKFFHKGMNK